MHRLPAVIVAALGLIAPVSIVASEIDNFTQRYQPLEDSADVLNRYTRAQLREAIKEANRESRNSCQRPALYDAIRERVASELIGQIERYAGTSPEVPHLTMPLDQSVYGAHSMFQKADLWLGEPVLAVSGTHPIVNLDGHVIGVDKLGHFMAQGWSYFTRAYDSEGHAKAGGVKNALVFGLREERTIYGGLTTGVVSYADMASNFQGMRFWHELLDGSRPLVECHAGQFVEARSFDWRGYVDDSWDEGINCSVFTSPFLAARVSDRLKELSRRDGRRYQCPVKPESCQALESKFGPEVAPFLLSPQCRNGG